ncbi:hypothetical protein EGW08_006408 [Elysia chlorotica]|uniref:ISXO2-like transposase domain-containing protein n=1 Tax=Elysia chlorotica TaxID=188477 RepID=A0A3S1C8E9_ELYCH|nr:hypothetical protein EGW08_006408 [Elysia chlorotica]
MESAADSAEASAGPSRPKRARCDCPPPALIINLAHYLRHTGSEQQTIDFCQQYGLLPKTVNCPKCNNTLEKIHVRPAATVSPRKCTWFEATKIPLRKTLVLTYLWTRKTSYKDAVHETSGPEFGDKSTSTETVADLFSYCREVCAESLLEDRASDTVTLIGGPNLTVEIDEAKFGKRKFHFLFFFEGQWVLGGICRETRDCFLVPVQVQHRSADTLLALIQERVAPGSHIITDEWRAYSRLATVGYTHGTVNHSQNFVNPETGANTNLIENTWWCIKRSLPATHTRKEHFAAHLAEFIWRKKHQTRDCLFTAFLEDVVVPSNRRVVKGRSRSGVPEAFGSGNLTLVAGDGCSEEHDTRKTIVPSDCSLHADGQNPPSFLQIYFFDDQVARRKSIFDGLLHPVLLDIQESLKEHHKYAKEIRCAYEFAASQDLQDFSIIIKESARPAGTHPGRYNKPDFKEVAVLMPNEPAGHRDIVLRLRDNGLRRISELHKAYDSLQCSSQCRNPRQKPRPRTLHKCYFTHGARTLWCTESKRPMHEPFVKDTEMGTDSYPKYQRRDVQSGGN